MNELKPEDVMKALECHSLADISTCDDCPYCDISEQGNCGCDMARDALALLREKDAKIERLRAEIGRLGEQCRVLTIEYPKTTRAEAITEFAERLKAKAYTNNYCQEIVLESDIDQIAKEMKEDLS